MILMIDNYDSFTYNVVQYLGEIGAEIEVYRNDEITLAEIEALAPDKIVISPGPCTPNEAGISLAVIEKFAGKIPLLGICLGHQILTHAFGGKTFKLKFGHRGGNQPVKDLRSGAVSITSQNHGFATDRESLPSHVEVTHLNLNDNTVEGIRSTSDPVFSVQYHPEAAPGPHDASYIFKEFADLIDATK